MQEAYPKVTDVNAPARPPLLEFVSQLLLGITVDMSIILISW